MIAPPSSRPPSLPPLAAPLVGREREVSELESLLSSGARVVTLSGPGGVGKTRVAHELAERARTTGADVIVVSLEDAGSREAVLDAVGRAAGLPEISREGARDEAIGRALAAHGPALLVLDPFDRVDDGAARLRAWLSYAPGLAVLVCSRVQLRVPGERVVELAPLSSADGLELLLSLARAQRGAPWEPSAEELAALGEIVRRVDGLPLAIELLAPRLSVMGPAALLHRLGNRLDLAARRASGGALDRHATLEASIDWSVATLDPPARLALAQCAVFRGGFSAEAAERVLSLGEGAPDALDVVQQLRDRSLLSAADAGGEVRLSLLAPVREHAARMLDSAELAATEGRHAAYFVERAEVWAKEGARRDGSHARAALRRERENLMAIVERVLSHTQVSTRAADRALRALLAIAPQLLAERALERLARDLEQGLAITAGSGADPRLQGRALALRAEVRLRRRDVASAERDLAEALVLAHHVQDRHLEARVLVTASRLATQRGDDSRAEAAIDRARDLGRDAGDATLAIDAALARAALALRRGDAHRARSVLEEAHAEAKLLGDVTLAARVARWLATAALSRLDLDGAVTLAERAIQAALEAEDPRGAASARVIGGAALLAKDDVERARTELDAAISLLVARGADAEARVAEGLLGLAYAARGAHAEARVLLAEALSVSRWAAPRVAALYAAALARAAAAAGRPDECARLVTEARALAAHLADPAAIAFIAGDGVLAPTLGAPRSLFEALLARVPLDAPAEGAPLSRSLEIGAQASWFRAPGGERVDLSKRKPLRLLLEALAAARQDAPGTTLPWDALMAAGWPGERMRADAGAHRVRVAISTLRKLGLAGVLETREEGYRLDPAVPLVATGATLLRNP